MHTLTVKLIGRDGKPAPDDAGQVVEAIGVNGGIFDVEVAGGTGTIDLPKDKYAIVARIGSGTADKADYTLVYVPFASLKADRTVTLDARAGKPVSVKTDRSDAVQRNIGASFILLDGTYEVGMDLGPAPLYAVPVKTPTGELWYGNDVEMIPRTGSAYAYHLAFASQDQIPTNLAYRVHNADLATVQATYHAQGKPALASRSAGAFYLPEQDSAFGPYTTVPLPGKRIEYYTVSTAGGQVMWSNTIIQRPANQPNPSNDDGFMAVIPAPVKPGSGTEEWNRGVFGPDLQHWEVGTNLIGRIGDTLIASTNLFAPWDPDHGVNPNVAAPYQTGSTTLSRNGKVVVTSPTAVQMVVDGLPAGSSKYTLSTTATRPAPWSALSRRVDTTWTFKSSHTSEDGLTFLPLLTVQASGNFDDLNRAPGFAWFPINLRVLTQRGAKAATVTGVTLDISTDDGKTWQQGWVIGGSGANWTANVFNPHAGTGTGFVSLRLSATDAAGGRVDETIIRAYGLVDH
jgi:hypothetical protein